MRKYEMMVLFKPNLSEEDLKKEEEKIKNFVLDSNGEFINSVPWGKRKLAYPIQKLNEGFYVLYYFKIPQNKLKEFKTVLKLNINILRHIILKLEES